MAPLEHQRSAVNEPQQAFPSDARASTLDDVRVTAQGEGVQQVMATITAALKQRSKVEAVIVGRMQQRADLYEKVHVQAKQAAIDAAGQDTVPLAREARQREALVQSDVELLPADMLTKLAAFDARRYGALREPAQCTTAALAMAKIAQFSANYRGTLAQQFPAQWAAVERAVTASEASTPNQAPVQAGTNSGDPRHHADTGVTSPDPMAVHEAAALERVAAQRARDAKAVAEQFGLNSIEQVIQQTRTARRAQVNETGGPNRPTGRTQSKGDVSRGQGDNQVAADEVFSAVKDACQLVVPAEVQDKYLRVGSKYYDPRYTRVVAFEDKGNKLETRSNSAQIAAAMVAIARARGWDEIKVAGTETFRQEVWREAAVHDMQVKGYTPSETDKAELAKRHQALEVRGSAPHRQPEAEHAATRSPTNAPAASTLETNKAKSVGQSRTQQTKDKHWQPSAEDQLRAQAFAQRSPHQAVADYPELAGAYAVMASIDKQVAIEGLSPRQRAVVMARVEANLVNSIERGHVPTLKVRAPQEPVEPRRTPEKDRTR